MSKEIRREGETRIDSERNSDAVLGVRDVGVSFPTARGESRVVNNVSFDIYREEILGIVGESGSGKSMLASSLLNAVVDPGTVSGKVMYYPSDDEPTDIASANRQELTKLWWEEISFAIQGAQSAFNPTMNVRTHFVETLRAHDRNVDDGLKHARGLLEDLYLDPDLVFESYPDELSGGMKQRALIALSLILKPNVLVMDEPTAALDLLMQRSIVSLLQDIKKKYDLTLVFVTHDLPLVANIANRIAVMYAFEIAEIGPTRELLANASHPYTRALLNSVPNLDASPEDVTSITGSSPDPVDVPDGCSYHPRCPLADSTCRSKAPPFHDVESGHVTACHHWKQARQQIPLDIATTEP